MCNLRRLWNATVFVFFIIFNNILYIYTHTHTYICMYMYIYIHICVYIFPILLKWIEDHTQPWCSSWALSPFIWSLIYYHNSNLLGSTFTAFTIHLVMDADHEDNSIHNFCKLSTFFLKTAILGDKFLLYTPH